MKSLPPRGAWIEICSRRILRQSCKRRSPHGERGLKCAKYIIPHDPRSRSPHGERGLKLIENEPLLRYDVSLPPRGAWIEIAIPCVEIISVKSLPPRGAWIEIAEIEEYNKSDAGRSPHGERGLKYLWPRFLVQAYPGRSPTGSVD